jgi:hypothetical protein
MGTAMAGEGVVCHVYDLYDGVMLHQGNITPSGKQGTLHMDDRIKDFFNAMSQ